MRKGKYLYNAIIHITARSGAVRKKPPLSRCPERAAGLGVDEMGTKHHLVRMPLSEGGGGYRRLKYIGGNKNVERE